MQELREHMAQIEAKAAAYTAERAQLAAQREISGDEEHNALLDDVLARVDSQLAALHKALQYKRDRLAFYDHLDEGPGAELAPE